MGRKNVEKIYGIDKRLHQIILEDMNSPTSLILTSLMDDFNHLSNGSKTTLVNVRNIPLFIGTHNKNITYTNAKKEFRKKINEKLRNVRAGSKTESPFVSSSRTSFSILEILEYCKMLKINPLSILLHAQTPTSFLPIEYCTRNEIATWVLKAQCSQPTKTLVRIPFRNAPLIDVSMDVYFMSYDPSSDKLRTLKQMLALPDVLVLSNHQADIETTISSKEVEVQMQIIITTRTNFAKKQFKPHVFPILGKNTKKVEEVIDYLTFADRCFADICEKRYSDEQVFFNKLDTISDNSAPSKYCSDKFKHILLEYLTSLKARHYKADRSYPKFESVVLRKYYSCDTDER